MTKESLYAQIAQNNIDYCFSKEKQTLNKLYEQIFPLRYKVIYRNTSRGS